MKPTISVIVVARNEEKTIAHVIKEVQTVLPGITSRYEILVNDDVSTDRTPKILDSLKRRCRQLHIYHQTQALGIARGMEFLYQKARCQYVFVLPGDGQYTVLDLAPMLQKVGKGCAIVVGKRIQKQYMVDRKIISFLFNGLTRLLFGVETFDAGSIKLYRKTILTKFQPLSHGVYNEAERIVRAAYAGHRICWSPVVHVVRAGGKATGAKPALIWEALTDMMRLWFLLRIRRKSPIAN